MTIDITGLDCDGLLSDWRWLVPEELRPFCMTVFGDWFFTDDSGKVLFLDLVDGRLKEVADSKEDWLCKRDMPEHRDRWFMPALANACFDAGMVLGGGQCLGYKLPPSVGGKLELGNMEVTDIMIHESILGQILKGTKDLPEGTRINSFRTQD